MDSVRSAKGGSLSLARSDTAKAVNEHPDELQPGEELLGGQYTITRFLNSGGFGITYLAKDSLDREVVIKECFPEAICRRSVRIVRARSRSHQDSFRSIVDLFVREARSQAKLVHPNIVAVHQVFKQNDTAYMAIDFVGGGDMLHRIEDPNKKLSPEDIQHWLCKLLDAVKFIHNEGMLHRDISPDNILVSKDNEPILIDFGAAREQATRTDRVLSTMRVVKEGYSPQEFYVTGGVQNPSSDLYSLAATFYHAVSGSAPADSQMRLMSIAENLKDNYEPLVGRIKGYPEAFLASIDKALNILPKDRFQSAQEWLDLLDSKSSGKTKANRKSAKPRPAPAKTAGPKPAKEKGKTPLVMAASVVALMAVGGVIASGVLGTNLVIGDPDPTDASAVTEAVAIDATTTDRPQPIEITAATISDSVVAAPADVAAVPSEDSTGSAAPRPIVAEANDAAATLGTASGGATVVRSAWTVELPFVTTEVSVKEGTFAMITLMRSNFDPGAQYWLKSGTIIYAVNDMIVHDIASFTRAVAQSVNLPGEEYVEVNVRVRASETSPLEEHMLSLRVVHSVELKNGFNFTITRNSDAWEVRAARVPLGANTTLKVGDVIISEAQTKIVMEQFDDLEIAFSKLDESSAERAYFTVSRDGKLESATIALSRN